MRPVEPKRKFVWEPRTFEAVQAAVRSARELAPGQRGKDALTVGVKESYGLFCPAPPSDASSRYRVGIDREGLPEIQRQDEVGLWRPAT
jgi:hypothetical protein